MTVYLPDNVWVELYTEVDGLPTWTNIGNSINSPIKVSSAFSNGDPLDRLAPGGDMRFDLRNTDSTFDPSTTFYKGQKIRLRVKYGSLVKVKFFGYIDVMTIDVGTWGAQEVHVTAVTWLTLASRTPVRAIPGLTDTTVDAAVRILLTQMQIQPEALDFDIGNVTLPYVFNQITTNSTIYSELNNLIMGEWGYMYERDGGMTLKIENSLSRTGDGSDYKTTSYYKADGVATTFLLEAGTDFLLEDGTTFQLEGEPTAGSFDSDFGEEYTDISINHGDNLTNKISASAIPTVVGGSTLTLYPFDIATGSKALLIPTNSESRPYLLQGQYKDPVAGGSQVSGSSIVTPVVSTDWTFNSLATGLGTDLSANVTITFTAGASGFKASIVNTGAAGYLTKFKVRGIPVYRYAPVETVVKDDRSIWDYGDYSLQFTRQYGSTSDDVQPYIFRLLMRDRKPRMIASNPKIQAFDSQDHLAGFLALDVGDQIRLASTKPATDSLYYIQGVKFTIQPGSEAITFDYITTETLAGAIAGVTEIAVETSSTVSGASVDFGVLPLISNMSTRTISARIYRNNSGSGTSTITARGYSPYSSRELYLTYSAGSWKINFLRGSATNSGLWQTNTAVIAGDTWYSIAVTFDQSSLTNDPVIYVNGVSVPITEIFTPAGVYEDESLLRFTVGDAAVTGSWSTSNFKFENVSVHNRILTATEITAIYNGGTRLPFASYPMTGLKFFFGGMDDATYATKLDGALGTSDTVYELVNGFTGQPINSPTLRAVG